MKKVLCALLALLFLSYSWAYSESSGDTPPTPNQYVSFLQEKKQAAEAWVEATKRLCS